jgi:hypothetical protein
VYGFQCFFLTLNGVSASSRQAVGKYGSGVKRIAGGHLLLRVEMKKARRSIRLALFLLLRSVSAPLFE